MPYCTYKGCHRKDIDLPETEFDLYRGKRNGHCRDCRQRELAALKRSEDNKRLGIKLSRRDGAIGAMIAHRVNTGASEVLVKGEPPKFAFEWERKRYQEWLFNLAKLVERKNGE